MARPILSDFDFGSKSRLLSLVDPTTAQEAATKNYIDLRLPTSATRILSNTGNGSTTAYTLSVSVPSSLVLSCMVFVGGLLQRDTTDYTISGSTITFVSAPPNTSPILVYYASTVPTQLTALTQVTETTVALGTVTANFNIDFSKGSVYTVTIGAAVQMSFTGLTSGVSCTATVYMTNGGAYAWTYANKPKFPAGVALTYTTSGEDVITYTTYDGTVANMHAISGGKAFA